MVEQFFRDITTERLRRRVFTTAPELIKAIDDYSLIATRTPSRSSGLRTRATSCKRSSPPIANCVGNSKKHYTGVA
jgi:hypothetical protein